LKPEWWVHHWLKRRSTREKRKPVTRNDDDDNINNNNNNNNNNNKNNILCTYQLKIKFFQIFIKTMLKQDESILRNTDHKLHWQNLQ
jgi:hypothetical protein